MSLINTKEFSKKHKLPHKAKKELDELFTRMLNKLSSNLVNLSIQEEYYFSDPEIRDLFVPEEIITCHLEDEEDQHL